MADNGFIPLYEAYPAGGTTVNKPAEEQTPSGQPLPTGQMGVDEDLKNMINSDIKAKFGDGTPENFNPDKGYVPMKEPSILEQMHFGLDEALYADKDAMTGTLGANLSKYLIAENPKAAAALGMDKPTESVMPFMPIKVVAAQADRLFHALGETFDYMSKRIDKEAEGTQVYHDNIIIAAAKHFMSKELMDNWETNAVKKYYGDGFDKLTPDQRRKQMDDRSDALLKEQFPNVYGTKYAHSAWAGIGNVGVTALDPTMYAAPVAKTWSAAWHVGSAVGTIDAATHALAQTGSVKASDVISGYLGGGIFGVAGKGLGVVFNRARVASRNKGYNKVLDKYEEQMNIMQKSGADWNESIMAARLASNTDAHTLEHMYKTTGRTFTLDIDKTPTTSLLSKLEEKISHTQFYRTVVGAKNLLGETIAPITDRLREKTPKIFHALRTMDARMHFGMHESFEKVRPWLEHFDGMTKADKIQMKIWLSSGDSTQFQSAFSMMKKYENTDPAKFKGFFDNFTVVRDELKRMGENYKGAGYEMDLIDNYFPRVARNPRALNDAHVGWMSWQIEKESKRLGRPLNETEIGNVFKRAATMPENDLAHAPTGGHLRQRIRPEIAKHLEPHYADPAETLHSYFRVAHRDIERANFFNRFSQKGRQFLINGSDLDKNVSHLISDKTDVVDEIVALSPANRERVASMLRNRFDSGERSPAGWVQAYKNMGYTLLLGNPISALTQLSDQAFALYKYGVRNFLEAWTLPKVIDKKAIGLSDAMEELYANTATTKKVLDFTLKWSGFNKLDKLGKDVYLNAAFRKYTRLAKSAKGMKEIESKWGRYFEGETQDLIEGLKAGDVSNQNVRLLLWHELADVQPIALSEMPEKYLAHPNMRILYMLKTFTMKQLAFMKREIFDEYAKGNIASANKKLVGFTGVWLLANGTSDSLKAFATGDDFDIEDNMVENLVQMTGFSRYQVQRAEKEGVGTSLLDWISPPIPAVDDISLAMTRKDNAAQALKAIPYVGTLMYKRIKNEKKRNKALNKALAGRGGF